MSLQSICCRHYVVIIKDIELAHADGPMVLNPLSKIFILVFHTQTHGQIGCCGSLMILSAGALAAEAPQGHMYLQARVPAFLGLPVSSLVTAVSGGQLRQVLLKIMQRVLQEIHCSVQGGLHDQRCSPSEIFVPGGGF